MRGEHRETKGPIRIKVENIYKIFGAKPDQVLSLLTEGQTRKSVQQKTGHVVALNNVSLSVAAGEISMIMGLSGSGKSTLARCINRLIEPTAGQVLLDGEDVTKAVTPRLREIRRTRISMVFQHFALLPGKTVLENAEFGLKLRGMPVAERRSKARQVLSVVGLSAWENHYPQALSGGMRQRVGLARALATDADVLIMDEPFSALDPLIRSEMQDELLRLQRMLKKTILFITHDFQEALKLGNRIAIMSEGEVVQDATPQEIVLSPQNEYVAAFTRDVDRTRLLKAHNAMVPGRTVVLSDDKAIVASQAADTFAVDHNGRVLGLVPAHGEATGRHTLSRNFATINHQATLIDAAAALRTGQLVAVIDEHGRFQGQIDPFLILHRIAEHRNPASSVNEGEKP